MIRFMDICISLLILTSSRILYVSAEWYYPLPTSIQPDHYHLKLITQLEDGANLTFHGEVSIRFQVTEDTKNITLHASKLTIDDARVELKNVEGQHDNFSTCIVGVDRIVESSFYIIHLCRTLPKSSTMYEVKLYFSGNFDDSYPGYSQHSYVDTITNETRRYAVADFSGHGAPFTFPCFNEPLYITKFTIWLGHHKSLKALSNMLLEKQIPLETLTDFVWSIFEESPPMLLRLVAFSVNDFFYKEIGSARIWCRPDYIDRCKYASEKPPQILKRLEQLIGIPFPLKKLEIIDAPGFESVSVCHSWDLITYDDSYVRNSEGIAEDLARQWFGKLVRPKWLTDYWLYEAYARLMASLFVDPSLIVQPSIDENPLLGADVYFNNPIPTKNSNSSNIFTFNGLTYKKGTYILKMIYSILGQDEFFEAIRDFITKYQYQNADQIQFWNILNEKAHKYKRISPQVHLKTIVDSWGAQTGFPAVNITRNYETGSMEISQHLFITHFNFDKNESAKCFWIPLSYTTASEFNFSTTTPKAWLECNKSGKGESLELRTTAKRNEWVIFNIQLSAITRIMYDNENWRLIAEALRSDRFMDIPYLNRIQLIDDLTTFARNSEVSYATVLDVLEYLVKEREYQPWATAILSFENVFDLLRSFPEHHAYFKAYMRYLIEPIYYHVHGLNDTLGSSDLYKKHLIANFACKVELEDCVHTAKDYFQKWKNSPNSNEDNTIPQLMKNIVYRTAISFGSADYWTFLWQQYSPDSSRFNKKFILTSLGCSQNATILRNYIGLLFDKDSTQLSKQDRKYGLTGIVDCGFMGSSLLWEYVVEHIHTLREDCTEIVNFAVSLLMHRIVSKEDRGIFSDFIESNKEYITEEYNFYFIYQEIKTNIQWMERSLDEMIPFLRNRLSVIGSRDDVVNL